MRRGEIVALRWNDADLESGKLRVERSLEQTNPGLDVVTVSRRLGHSSPTVTLAVYAHLFGNTDERAAAAVETALASALTG